MKHIVFLTILCHFCFTTKAQIVQRTSFEGKPGVFTEDSWRVERFNPRWVNGFDQDRCFRDTSQSRSGSSSLKVLFPSEAVGPENGGAQVPLELTPRQEYYASYWLRFSENFSWGTDHQGGKLPGLAGGDNCSGCIECDGENGFSARLMWRKNGLAVLYLYHMHKNSVCGDNYELLDSRNRPILFRRGQWYKITQRVKTNTGNQSNGEVQVWVNDMEAVFVNGLQFFNNGHLVDNFYFSTFHGGNDPSWRPGVDCYIWFDDLIIGTTLESVLKASK